MHRPGWILVGFAILTGVVLPRAARGDPPEPAPPTLTTAAQRAAFADVLFEEGRRLMAAGRFAQACAKFSESERLDHGTGTLLNLANCYEQNGQTASAWAGFRAAAASASAEGQAERERLARDRERRLLPLLARLTIVVPQAAAVPGLVVKRDELPVDPAAWGVPVPVDPGDHTVAVSAPGKLSSSQIIKVPRRSGAWLTATVPALADLPLPPAARPAPAPPPGLGGQQIAGIALGGVGIAAVIAGAALGAHAISRNADSQAHCHGDLCDASGVDIRRDARTAGTASTATLLAAGAALAGGAALYFTAGPSRPAAKAAVGLTPAGAGLSLEVAW